MTSCDYNISRTAADVYWKIYTAISYSIPRSRPMLADSSLCILASNFQGTHAADCDITYKGGNILLYYRHGIWSIEHVAKYQRYRGVYDTSSLVARNKPYFVLHKTISGIDYKFIDPSACQYMKIDIRQGIVWFKMFSGAYFIICLPTLIIL